MNENKTLTKSKAAIAEITRLRESINILHNQSIELEALARAAYREEVDTDRHNAPDTLPEVGAYALARIAVLEAENAAQREQLIRLTADLNGVTR